jgi:enterochelin esterase-like enzyme
MLIGNGSEKPRLDRIDKGPMTYTLRNSVIAACISGLSLAAGQAPPTSAKPVHVAAPTRDPETRGYAKAKELADGLLPTAKQNGNFIIGPTHAADSETTAKEGVPKGQVAEFTMDSKDSKIYPGVAREPGRLAVDPTDPRKLLVKSHPAPYTRKVAVYIPKQYVPGTEAPFIVGTDGPDRLLFATLDNLIAEKRVPAMIAISIGNGGGDAQGSQRGLEYDTMSGTYAEFVETEVLPLVETRYGVKLTRNPEGRAAMGCSSGAAAAMAMAWYRPDLYHRVLSYSGTYVYQQWPDNPATPHGAWEFHDSLIPTNRRKPLRLWLEVGDADNLIRRDEYHDWVLANERMAKALAKKGYPYQFVFAKNARHCDRGVKAQTLPLALEYVWRGYRGR